MLYTGCPYRTISTWRDAVYYQSKKFPLPLIIGGKLQDVKFCQRYEPNLTSSLLKKYFCMPVQPQGMQTLHND